MYVTDSWEIELAFYLRLFANFVLMYTMGKRLKAEHAITGNYSKIKIAYFLIFAGDFFAGITDNLLYKIGVFPYAWQVPSVTRLGADTFMMGLLVVFGLSLTTSIFNLKQLELLPGFFYGGLVVFYLITGRDDIFIWFVLVGSMASEISVLTIAFKLKDNGALGLGIMYLIAYSSLSVMFVPSIATVAGLNTTSLIDIGRYVWALLLAAGLIKPFKTLKQSMEVVPQQVEVARA
jgi:hypothetical protein